MKIVCPKCGSSKIAEYQTRKYEISFRNDKIDYDEVEEAFTNKYVCEECDHTEKELDCFIQ